ncbi:MAG: preprotein translocase subunit SecG [Steroidobacteraceae bacterium]
MNWLQTATLILHMFLCVGIVGLVLLQRGKGADAGAGFGAGASGTVFGARGSSSFLSRTTAILATLFFVTCLTLTYMGGKKVVSDSVVDRVGTSASSSVSAPALQVPATPAPATTVEQPAVPATGTEPATK